MHQLAGKRLGMYNDQRAQTGWNTEKRRRMNEQAMSNLLRQLQSTLQDTSLVPVKEWRNTNGMMGLYRSEETNGYVYIAVLVEETCWFQQYQGKEDVADLGAEVIAAFAGAEEMNGNGSQSIPAT